MLDLITFMSQLMWIADSWRVGQDKSYFFFVPTGAEVALYDVNKSPVNNRYIAFRNHSGQAHEVK